MRSGDYDNDGRAHCSGSISEASGGIYGGGSDELSTRLRRSRKAVVSLVEDVKARVNW